MNQNYHYCACIRTLGTAGEKYLQTLLSLKNQTIRPDRIIVYLAEGYPLPQETIGIEQYVRVKKGFIAQRALPYTEVNTPYALLLDDDVAFPPDMAEKLLHELNENRGDAIGVTSSETHTKDLVWKFIAAWSFTFPTHSSRWGIRIRQSGAFSYNSSPKRNVYETQSAIGYCSLWKKEVLLKIHFEEELYFDRFRYCLGDDQLMFNKAYQNGFRVLVSYDSNVKHLNAASGHVKENAQKFHELGAITFLIWHRTCYQTAKQNKWRAVMGYVMRMLFITSLYFATSFRHRNPRFIYYIQGIFKGIRMSRQTEYKALSMFKKIGRSKTKIGGVNF